MQELQAALEHTPIPHEDVIAKGHRTVWYTWFETFHKHSTLSCLFEAGLRCIPQLILQLAACCWSCASASAPLQLYLIPKD